VALDTNRRGTSPQTACDVDLDGDGTYEERVAPCPRTGRIAHTHVEWGKFAPRLRVSDLRGEAAGHTIV